MSVGETIVPFSFARAMSSSSTARSHTLCTSSFAPERMASEYVKRYEEMLARRRGEMSFVVETVLPSAKDQDGADPALAVA